MKHFAIMEVGGSESPMVGVIQNIAKTKQHKSSFVERLEVALNEHFDAEDVVIPEIDLNHFFTDYNTSLEFNVTIDGNEQELVIVETWIY